MNLVNKYTPKGVDHMADLKALHNMINYGTEEEKAELLKLISRELGRLAAHEGSEDARLVLTKAANHASGMRPCPKCDGSGTTVYTHQYYYEDGSLAYELVGDEDECDFCDTKGVVHKDKRDETSETINELPVINPKIEGHCTRCLGSHQVKYKIKLFYPDGTYSDEYDDIDECTCCI